MLKWFILLFAPIGAMSMKNWILIWVFLEMSSFSFIILSKNKNSSEGVMKYFLIQTMSSIFLMLSIISKSNMKSFLKMSNMSNPPVIMIFSLMLKSGMAPLHFWMMKVSESLNNKMMVMFLTTQKIAPLSILSSILVTPIMQPIIIMSSLLGTISQMMTSNLNILLTYSSVAHSSWMMISGMKKEELFFIYMISYSFMISQILFFMKKKKVKLLSNMTKSLTLTLMLLSLAGLPPFFGFFPKWISLLNILQDFDQKTTCFFLLIMACLNTFIYIRITVKKILKSKVNFLMKSKNEEHFFFITSLNMLSIPMIIFFCM